jgi:hypothetical protein
MFTPPSPGSFPQALKMMSNLRAKSANEEAGNFLSSKRLLRMGMWLLILMFGFLQEIAIYRQ